MNPAIVALLILNALSFLVFGMDKLFARIKSRRIPEKWLLVLLFTGVAGGLAGMMVFRHKSSKGSFQLKAVIPVLLGMAALVGVVWKFGDRI